MASSVKTRILIISDTHGMEFAEFNAPLQAADIAIHCGDLTEESKLDEFRASIRLLETIKAPLKLVIAGNHDFTLDTPAFKKKVADFDSSSDSELVKKIYGDYGEARQLLEAARATGIIFLDEGSHQFLLENGGSLNVFASPFTPSLSDWGFQYHPGDGHDFQIPSGTDVVITHGPPHGIMDFTDSRRRAGCPNLFAAVARARPRLHCFGHIHEGWGAKLVKWRDQLTESPSHFTDIDNDRSVVIDKLQGLMASKHDTEGMKEEKARRLRHLEKQRCFMTSHCHDDSLPLRAGSHTLFVNAAIEGTESHPFQLAWLVNLELLKSSPAGSG